MAEVFSMTKCGRNGVTVAIGSLTTSKRAGNIVVTTVGAASRYAILPPIAQIPTGFIDHFSTGAAGSRDSGGLRRGTWTWARARFGRRRGRWRRALSGRIASCWIL